MAARPLCFLLRTDRIAVVLDTHHLYHEDFARELGVSRQYWSALFNRQRHLTPMIRRRLLQNERLLGIPEEELWDVIPSGGARCLSGTDFPAAIEFAHGPGGTEDKPNPQPPGSSPTRRPVSTSPKER